jgi:hypothetical protein
LNGCTWVLMIDIRVSWGWVKKLRWMDCSGVAALRGLID